MGWTSTIIKHLNGVLGRHKAKDIDYDSSASASILIGDTNVQEAIEDLDSRIYNTDQVTKEPTGFTDPGNVIVTGDPTARTVTLTGTVEAYWRGSLVSALVSGWESPAHGTTITDVYFLSYNGTSFSWNNTPWTFDQLQIAFATYDPMEGTWFYIREPHGMEPYQGHEEAHDNIGTYKKSGGDLSGYVLDSTTAADRRPDVSQVVIKDEDLPSTLPVLNDGLYTHAALVGAGAVATFDIDNADIVELSGNNPYYNEFDGADWVETLMPANSVMSIWLYAIPVAADAVSQKYRLLWGQGQWITQAKNSSGTQIAIAQASEELRSVGELNLGTLTAISPEFVAIQRVIITYTGGNWYWNDALVLTGSKYSQAQSPSGNYLSSVSTDTTLTGAGTVSDPLSAVGLLQTTTDMAITNSFSNADIIFTANDGGVSKEMLRFDSSYPSIYTSNCSFGIGVAGPETIFHVNSGASVQAAIFESTSASGVAFNLRDPNTTDDLGFYGVANDMYIKTNGSEKLRITSAGLVRIYDTFKLTLGTGDDGQIYSSSDNLNIDNVTQDKDIIFNVNDGGSTIEALRIDASAPTIYTETCNFGIGTSTPGSDIAGGGASLTGNLLHFKGASTRFIMEGSSLADIVLADSGAAVDEKILRLVINGGYASFSAPADNLATDIANILTMDLGNGNVSMGQSLTVSGTLGVTGVATLGDSSQLASSAAPTADADIANKKYVDDSAGGGGTTATFTAGEAIAQYSAVGPASGGTSGRIYKMDANASNRINCTGVAATAAAGAGNSFTVTLPGQVITNGSWSFTVGLPVTVSTAAGVCLTTTAHLTSGRYMITVGYALTSTSMIVMPQLAHYIDPAGI